MPHETHGAVDGRNDRFPVTRVTMIHGLCEGREEERQRAWELLVSIYWKPIYTYIRIRWQKTREEAEDLTQTFLATLLEKGSLAGFDPSRARFRTFLRTLLDRFLANEWKASQRHKRGGGSILFDFEFAESEISAVAANDVPPDELLHREWIRSILSRGVDELSRELYAAGKESQLAIFRAYDIEQTSRSYRDIAEEMNLPVTTVTNHLASARRRFRQIVLDLVRETTASEKEYREEIRSLLGVES